jgi:non-heme chloroperoxidase
MESLNLEGATLVGFSMGGGEVVRYLSRYGENRVTCAVLASAVTPYLLKTADNPDGIEPKVFEEIAGSIRKDRFDFLKSFGAKFFGRTLIKHTVSESVLEWTYSMALTGSLRSTLAAANAWATTDFRDDMAKIAIPMRVIHGTGDETVPIEVSGRRSVLALPNATISEYEDEPHGLIFTAADRFNQELLAFIRGDVTVPTPPEKGMLMI